MSAMDVGAVKAPTTQRSYPCRRSRQSVSTLRKSVFQVHGIDMKGDVIIRRQLKRATFWQGGAVLISCDLAQPLGAQLEAPIGTC
jgi:hypothetical protein